MKAHPGSTGRILFVFTLILAFAIRLYELSHRPLHSDEGVNHFFITQVVTNWIYPYSHKNYHGPLFFYLSGLSRVVFGDEVFALRIVPVLSSVLSLFGVLLFRSLFGARFVLIAALCFALSSVDVFYARYAIHEELFATAGVFFAYYLLATLLYTNRRYLYRRYVFGAALALAALITIKETFIITGFCLLVALLLASIGTPYSLLRKPTLAFVKQLILPALLCVALVAAIYTAGFRWTEGLLEFAQSLPQWISRSQSDSAHHKPTLYYLQTLAFGTQPVLTVLACLCCYFAFAPGSFAGSFARLSKKTVDTEDSMQYTIAIRFLGLWWLSSLLVYSLIPYKMPWLYLNISSPMILFIAACLARVYLHYQTAVRLVVLCILSSSIYHSMRYSYPFPGSIPYGKGNPFSYVHTDDELLELARVIRSRLSANPNERLLITASGYWPLPFYLRSVATQVMYQGQKKESGETDSSSFVDAYEMVVSNKPRLKGGNKWISKRYKVTDYLSLSLHQRKADLVGAETHLK